MMATKYKTTVGATTAELDKAVCGLLQEGYVLYGNPYSSGDSAAGIALCQALIVIASPAPDSNQKAVEEFIKE
jgi:hypothetical protein